jgi:hypothetical protein
MDKCLRSTTNAQRIYQLLFAGDMPDPLGQRFTQSWEILAADFSDEEREECRRALEQIQDLEALECFCRHRKLLPALSAQVSLMVMLAETLPSHLSHYISARDNPILGVTSILWATSRTAWKFVKGFFLLLMANAGRRHYRG